MRKQDRLLIGIITAALVLVISIFAWQLVSGHQQQQDQKTALALQKKQESANKSSQQRATKLANAKKAADKKAALNLWKNPTGGAYPKLKSGNTLKLTVSLDKQRVYLDDETTNKRLYTMVCSSGKDNTTPKGTFAVQERGDSFFNGELNEGANYWVSWLYHGVYLFHSIPTDASGNYEVKEGEKLGQPASHGCIRLSVPDAKWLFDNIPQGTTVVVGA